MRIVAYVYEADLHCPDCARERFGLSALDAGAAIDREGNTVTPVFSTSEFEHNEACGDCFEIVAEGYNP